MESCGGAAAGQTRAMRESLRTRVQRYGFNRFPAHRGTGGRVTFISHDWREVRPVASPLRPAPRA